MIDYKAVVEDCLNDLKRFNIPFEYITTDSMVQIKIHNFYFTEYVKSPVNITNETYRHLLKMMFFELVRMKKIPESFPIKIIAVVFHERGSCPFEIEYDPLKSVQELHDYFQQETKKVAKYPIVFYIQKVYPDRNETIYLNTEMIKNLARG